MDPRDLDNLSGLNGDHRAYQDLLGAYALDAVSPDEARALAAHVAACPACRAELGRLRAAAASLPFVVEERDLPPISRYRLEARVLHDLAQPRQAPPASASGGTGAAAPPSPAARPASPGQPPVPDAGVLPVWPARIPSPLPSAAPSSGAPVPGGRAGAAWGGDAPGGRPVPRLQEPATAYPVPAPAPGSSPTLAPSPAPLPLRSRRWPLGWLAAAAVLAVVAAGLLAWNLDLRGDLDDRESPAAVALVAEQAEGDANATMTYLDDAGVMVIALHGAPPPPPDEVYQLWLVHDTVVIPFGIFDHETAECAVTLPDPASYQQLVITREPGPFGSPSAVGPTILVAPLEAA